MINCKMAEGVLTIQNLEQEKVQQQHQISDLEREKFEQQQIIQKLDRLSSADTIEAHAQKIKAGLSEATTMDTLPEDEVKPDVQLTPTPVTAVEPMLQEYFTMVHKRAADINFMKRSLHIMTCDRTEVDKAEAADKEWYDNHIQPALTKAFLAHDMDSKGVLDKDEARVFFSHLFAEDSESMRALQCIAHEQNIKTQMWMAASMVPQEFWETYEEKQVEYEQEVRSAIQLGMDAAEKDVEQHMEDYRRFKSERDS